MMNIKIDNIDVSVPDGTTILDAARKAGIYIPVVCSHPDLPSFHHSELSEFIYQGDVKLENDPGAAMNDIRGCGICLVFDENADKPVPSCATLATDGMLISTTKDFIALGRRDHILNRCFRLLTLLLGLLRDATLGKALIRMIY